MVTLMGNPVTLEGTPPESGRKAPDFVLRTGLGPDTGYDLSSDAGKVRILNVVPSLDTPVCQIQTKRFNQEAAGLPNVKILTISADLPVAQARWCGAEGIDGVSFASDYYDGNFGRSWGLRINELGVLARAVYVLDGDGNIHYAQVVDEISHEPDYEPALLAARERAG
jgi:thiol peroxidase